MEVILLLQMGFTTSLEKIDLTETIPNATIYLFKISLVLISKNIKENMRRIRISVFQLEI